MPLYGLDVPELDGAAVQELERAALAARGAVLTMTSLAGSGHPGGSFSAMEILTLLYRLADLRPTEPRWSERDRVVVSNGHISPGVYAALACAGFFPLEEVAAHFRQAGSPFEGHVERAVPGVEWSTGNLGQGLSAAVGFAIAARLTGSARRTWVVMSDAEQHKGQVGEARRLAAKERLGSLVAVVDWNGVQISGHTREVMPVDVRAGFEADGWRVIECDGHDFLSLHAALVEAASDAGTPAAVLARTVIGRGVSFMEDRPEFHGRALKPDEYEAAMRELGLSPDIEDARERRSAPVLVEPLAHAAQRLGVSPGPPRDYGSEHGTDNRSAWGAALADIAGANPELPIAVFDCDLMDSVKTSAFAEARPEGFIECGVGEHNAGAVAGAVSASGVLTFWADFGVFGLDEAYNQQRLNDINGAALKLVLTHCGLDVGEDGKTHQCLDYVGALRDFFGWRVIVPADPDQTDRAVRAMAAMGGNVCLAVGRSKAPPVTAEDGVPAFGGDYRFRYGRFDRLREGSDVTVLAMGTVTVSALRAADLLRSEGIGVAFACVACPLDLADEDMEWACRSPLVVSAEDHSPRTGLGASAAAWMASRGCGARLVALGVSGYRSSGNAASLLQKEGLDPEGIAASIRREAGRSG